MSKELQLEPIVVSTTTARNVIDVGNTKFWALVKAGTIELVEVGGRKMVVYDSLKRLAGPRPQATPPDRRSTPMSRTSPPASTTPRCRRSGSARFASAIGTGRCADDPI